jgi:Male sterility protein
MHNSVSVQGRARTILRHRAGYALIYVVNFPREPCRNRECLHCTRFAEKKTFKHWWRLLINFGCFNSQDYDMAHAELSYLQPEETMEKSPMQNFYAGKCIFLTGATGFMGKIISEKLMRTCPDIKAIYMLIRPKKGKEITKRFEEIFNDPVSRAN